MSRTCFSTNGFNICIGSFNDKIISINIDSKDDQISSNEPVLINAKKQIIEYLNGDRDRLSIEYSLDTTEFAKKVYIAAIGIPYGQTLTYGEVAEILGDKKKARAVGNALNKNMLPILIPCHRVVAVNGIGGFGAGPDLKIKLLNIEKNGAR